MELEKNGFLFFWTLLIPLVSIRIVSDGWFSKKNLLPYRKMIRTFLG